MLFFITFWNANDGAQVKGGQVGLNTKVSETENKFVLFKGSVAKIFQLRLFLQEFLSGHFRTWNYCIIMWELSEFDSHIR